MDFVGVCKLLLILVSWTTKIVNDKFIIIIIPTDAYQSPARPGLHKFRCYSAGILPPTHRPARTHSRVFSCYIVVVKNVWLLEACLTE